jgi:ubiquinone biosynthesis protein
MPFGFPIRATLAQITRARHIAQVLVRNGLGFVAEITGFTRFLPPWRKRSLQADPNAAGRSVPHRLRITLEELGPTFIKLGQILSTRPDILPQEYIVELSKLLDAAPPVPLDQIRDTIETEFGRPIDELFSRFDREPIASASIGQVHRALLPDGTAVVVKVQRPGIRRVVYADLNLLRSQTRFLEARSETLAGYGLTEIAEEFAESLQAELDYTQEGRNADRLREIAESANVDVIIPRIYWKYTTRAVITMDDLKGITLTDPEALVQRGYDLTDIAEQVIDIYLQQVFVQGIFHADPHPANILVYDGRIGLVDFGMVGHLARNVREQLGDLLFALVRQDADEMLYIVARMGALTHASDLRALRRDLQRLLVRYYDASLENLPIARFLADVSSVAFRHNVRLPSDLALLARTVVVLEGVVRGLDPSVRLSNYLEPFIIRVIRERVSLKRVASESIKTLRDLEQALHVMPRRVDMLTEQLERGELTLRIDVRDLDVTLGRIEAMENRVSFSVVVAAIVIGSALILLAGEAAFFVLPFTEWVIPIPQIGFLFAGLLGAWWLFSIVRSKGL